MMMVSYFGDDISSIESSNCRERRHSYAQLSAQKSLIASLSNAVSRLATTLESKEEAHKAKERAFMEEMKMRERTESDLESKVLDLVIENSELKNRVVDLEEGVGCRELLQWRAPPVTPSSNMDDLFSLGQVLPSTSHSSSEYQTFESLNKENGELVLNEDIKHHVSGITKLSLKPHLKKWPRVSVSINSKLGSTSKSLLTTIKKTRLSWIGMYPKLIPRHIFIDTELVFISDDVSEVSYDEV